jgi:hypothetical protein
MIKLVHLGWVVMTTCIKGFNLFYGVLQLEFFIAFKLANPNIQVQLTSFQLLKPWFKWLKQWNTCCCRYHIELKELMLGLDWCKKSWEFGVHGNCVCSSEVCKPTIRFSGQQSSCAHLSLSNVIIALWMSIHCLKGEFDLLHKRVCLMG